jgi:hypothetical protein
MTVREFTEEENRILREALRLDKPDAPKQLSKDEQRIAELVKLSELRYQQQREQAAEQLKIGVGALDKIVSKKRKQLASERKKIEPPDPGQLWCNARHIANHPHILDLFGASLGREIAGEKVNGKLLYLVATSRLFDKPMHAAIKGTSAGGKSEIRKRILQFFPPESIVAFTSISEKALIYYEGDFAHKIFSMAEAVAAEEQSFQDYLLRELMSEGRIRHDAAQKIGDSIITVTIEKQGPVAFMVTTTKAKLHPENETRMLSLEIDDTERQTREVIRKVAQVHGINNSRSVDYEQWRDFQRWLEHGDREVVVSYAEALAEMVPPVAVRLRRDFGQVLCAIQAHALLHREQRDRDDAGRIIADLANDYAAVRELMNAILAEGAGVAVNPAMTETITAVEKATATLLQNEGASAQDIGKVLKLDKSAAWRRLIKARNEGFIVNLETRKGMPGKYRATQQEVEPLNILPSVEEMDEKFDNSTFTVTPLKSTPPCNREEIQNTDHEDDDCTDGCNPVARGIDRLHGCKPVANDLATVKPLTDEQKSVPIARLPGNRGGCQRDETQERGGIELDATFSATAVVDIDADRVKVAEREDDFGIPASLRRNGAAEFGLELEPRPALDRTLLSDDDLEFLASGKFK